jgi:hypothetical protein
MSVLEQQRPAPEATIVMRGFSPAELRCKAAEDCRRCFGDTCQITGETITPALVSLGGRVRLYEGRFLVSRP